MVVAGGRVYCRRDPVSGLGRLETGGAGEATLRGNKTLFIYREKILIVYVSAIAGALDPGFR
jgi:hypothetical protein